MEEKDPDRTIEAGNIGLENLNKNLESSGKSRRYVTLADSIPDQAENPTERAESAFPGFTFDHDLPFGFSDASLETDDTPSFRNLHLNLCLCLDLEDTSVRKTGPKSKRYRLLHMDGRGEPIPDIAPVTESERWEIFAPAMYEAILKAHGWRIINTDELGDSDHTAWVRSLATGKRAYITGADGNHHIGAADHVMAAIFWPDGDCIYTHADTLARAIVWVSDNAEAAHSQVIGETQPADG